MNDIAQYAPPKDAAAERADLLARCSHELAKAIGDGSLKRQRGEKPSGKFLRFRQGDLDAFMDSGETVRIKRILVVATFPKFF
jgi:hypothetical protein